MSAPLNRVSFLLAAGLAIAAQANAQGSPNYTISYILQPAGNQTAIGAGGTIAFPSTRTGATATASFIIYNSGSGAGMVNGISSTGSAFQVSGLPLFPANLAAGSEIRFTITFAPAARGPATGSLTLDLSTGRVGIGLTGQGSGPVLSYTATGAGAPSTLVPGATLTFPTTNIGANASIDIRVTNTGDASATVSAINISGASFKLAAAPPLPATLAPNASLVFTIAFNPTAAGNATGALVIDGATFNLAAVGLGSQLVYATASGSATTPIQANGTVVFPATNVGSTSSLSVVITNTGNTAAAVSGIAVSGTGFSLPNPPKLPATISPNGSLQFNVAFTAASTASVTGVLQIDSFGVNLRGNGNPPPSLSSVVFGSLPATVTPRQQPSVGLALSQPYPMEIAGKLTLTFTSDSFADDPSIQFASGGRSANFTIPAGSVDAVFPSGKQIQLQTGTVAGAITLAANFSVAAVDLTPNPAPAAKMVLQAAPPQITNVQIGARSNNSFELLITGLSTPRQVSQLGLQFTPAAGAALQSSSLSINTDAPFSSWFQSQAGIGFGSQFTASVIINVAGDITAVQSVAVTASNARGDSNSMSVALK